MNDVLTGSVKSGLRVLNLAVAVLFLCAGTAAAEEAAPVQSAASSSQIESAQNAFFLGGGRFAGSPPEFVGSFLPEDPPQPAGAMAPPEGFDHASLDLTTLEDAVGLPIPDTAMEKLGGRDQGSSESARNQAAVLDSYLDQYLS